MSPTNNYYTRLTNMAKTKPDVEVAMMEPKPTLLHLSGKDIIDGVDLKDELEVTIKLKLVGENVQSEFMDGDKEHRGQTFEVIEVMKEKEVSPKEKAAQNMQNFTGSLK